MKWPLLPLVFLGVLGGLMNLPLLFGGHSWLSDWLNSERDILILSSEHESLLIGSAVGVFILGWIIAHLRYRKFSPHRPGLIGRFLLNGWYFDALFARLVVRPFERLGSSVGRAEKSVLSMGSWKVSPKCLSAGGRDCVC